jgi:hypothetical protein
MVISLFELQVGIAVIGLVALGFGLLLERAARRGRPATQRIVLIVGLGEAAFGCFCFFRETLAMHHGALFSPALVLIAAALPCVRSSRTRGAWAPVFVWSTLLLLLLGCSAEYFLEPTYDNGLVQERVLLASLWAPTVAAMTAATAGWLAERKR